ncbi:AAA family ATPase [Polyangium sp. 6x1]|uniref:AAA family ATPase n=1 Tax=Polyangium sp. 6x1 TaxID=3042689 RepID=UPI0024825DF7|nr:AAA family ATPase [Polyangium sp. 6x1]MDI1450485.1 AAA family ATPase [Polyangium sp. 6x1]
MLTSFAVENYRAFTDETTIELRPLTLLFGYNNAGKSALIRALALIADSTRSDIQTPLDLSSEAARDCNFEDLVSKFGGSNTLKFGFTFHDGLRAEYHITEPPGTYQPVITRVQIETGGKLETYAFDLVSPSLYTCLRNGQPTGELKPYFTKLTPYHLSTMPGDPRHAGIDESLRALAVELIMLGIEVQWIGSLRRCPQRFTRYRGGARSRIGPDGVGVGELLAHDKLVSGSLLSDVSRWYEEQFNRKVDAIQLSDARFALTLNPLTASNNRTVNIADTGEGMAQVLPVLVAAAMARHSHEQSRPILAIEQPELHLHPAVHAPLAKYLCDVAATKRPRMLVETHSENFLLGVQLQIVKREISPDDVLVYWVKQGEDGSSRVQRITFDNEGYPEGFPDGVFEEDLDLARLLLELRERNGT